MSVGLHITRPPPHEEHPSPYIPIQASNNNETKALRSLPVPPDPKAVPSRYQHSPSQRPKHCKPQLHPTSPLPLPSGLMIRPPPLSPPQKSVCTSTVSPPASPTCLTGGCIHDDEAWPDAHCIFLRMPYIEHAGLAQPDRSRANTSVCQPLHGAVLLTPSCLRGTCRKRPTAKTWTAAQLWAGCLVTEPVERMRWELQ